MTRRLVVSALPGEVRSALLVDGRLEDLAIERADRPSLLGNLYHGRVTKVDKTLDAAFVDLGTAAPGFLPLSEAPKRGLSEGDALAVRVLREGDGGKGPRLSGRIKDPPDWLDAKLRDGRPPALLASGNDPLARLLSSGVDLEEAIFDDAAILADAKRRLAAVKPASLPDFRLDSNPSPLFERQGIEAEIEALLAPRVDLPSGGFLLIEPVTTLTAIDVNTGRHRSGGGSEDRALAVNLEAARLIPRQLRLRALSGLIVIDFLALESPEGRRRVVVALKREMQRDPEPARVFPMARSGLVEMTRRRGRPALHELMTRPCGIDGSGRIKEPVTLAFDVLRRLAAETAAEPSGKFGIAAAPEVIAALRGPAAAACALLRERLGRDIVMEEAPVAPGESARVNNV